MAKYLQRHEGGDEVLVELAALMHSATETNFNKTDDEKFRSHAMRGMLDVLDVSDEKKDIIIEMSNQCRFLGLETARPKTIEGKILQDANWLDGIGAIGIARVFTAGGFLGRMIFNPFQKSKLMVSSKDFQKLKMDGDSIGYFYEKTLKTAELLNTKTAIKIAEKRILFLRNYLAEFKDEWEMKDLEN